MIINFVERMTSSEQSTRPIFRSGCVTTILCDASYMINIAETGA